MRPFHLDAIKHYSALLFDFDGTLVDSMPAHNKAWQAALRPHGIEISDAELYALAGTPSLKTAEIFVERFHLNVSAQLIVEKKEALFDLSLPAIEKIPAVAEIAYQFHQELPLGIVSGGIKPHIIAGLNVTGMSSLFQCIVSCEDTERGKPFPDPFHLGAKLLGVPSQRCLVFEDGAAGIQAAQSAQMDVIYVRDGALYFWDP